MGVICSNQRHDLSSGTEGESSLRAFSENDCRGSVTHRETV